MIRKAEYVCVFLSGGLIYNLIEMAFRGYTHWSMNLAGGACFLAIHLFNHRIGKRKILLKCALGCVTITTVEFFVGLIVNFVFHLDVWDYSSMRWNILGQICPLFSLAWFFITFPACRISDAVRRFFNSIEQNEKILT